MRRSGEDKPFVRIISCPEVLHRVWPPERWLLGMQLCHGLRQDFAMDCVSLKVTVRKYNLLRSITPEVLQSHLSRFSSSTSVTLYGAAPRHDFVIQPEEPIKAVLSMCTAPSLDAEGLCREALQAWSRAIPTAFNEALLCALEACIPAFLHNKLVHLDLSATGLGDEGSRRLAVCLGQCTALARLELANNKIGEAGAVHLSNALRSCTSLLHVDLSFNDIAGGVAPITRALAFCPDLTSLDLTSNRLRGNSAHESLHALTSCSKLSVLELSFNLFHQPAALPALAVRSLTLRSTALPPGLNSSAFLDSLHQLTSLTFLDFADNNLRFEGVVRLSQVVSSLSALTHLGVANSGCSRLGLEPLSLRLHASCPRLASVNFSRCGLLGAFACPLTTLTALDLSHSSALQPGSLHGILHRNSALTELKLDSCSFVGPDPLAPALRACPRLASLDLASVRFDTRGMCSLAAVLALHSVLTSLDLNNTHLQADALEHVAGLLRRNTLLTRVHLGNLNLNLDADAPPPAMMDPASASELVGSLAGCEALEMVDLEGAGIRDEGVVVLAVCLPRWRVLARMELASNGITAEGAAALAGAMSRGLSSLRRLNLSRNPLGDQGVAAVAGAVSRCEGLRTLVLRGVDAGDEGAGRVAEALGECRALGTVDLSENRVGPGGVEALNAALQGAAGGSVTTLLLEENSAASAERRGLIEVLPLDARVTHS